MTVRSMWRAGRTGRCISILVRSPPVVVLACAAACYASTGGGDATEAPCTPGCPAWRECGTDGCGGSCGSCPEGLGCGPAGVCVPAVCAEPRLVPAGEFMMGRRELWFSENPIHLVFVSTFRMGACEVTNGEWRACVAAGECEPPEQLSSPGYDPPRPAYYDAPEFTHHPVTCMRGEQAALFCRWAGGRLPTEAEWEKAARGGCEMRAPASCGPEDEPLYPWSSDPPDCSRANHWPYPERWCVGDTDTVGARAPADESVYGIHDLAGNVDEWVHDYYDAFWYSNGGPPWIDPTGPTEPVGHALQVFRGDSWNSWAESITVTHRQSASAGLPWQRCAGLRCAWPVE